MYFYEVAPASRRYHGADLLTYHSTEKLQPGQIIVVKIRSHLAPAFVVKVVAKPTFNTLPISEISPNAPIPTVHSQLFTWLQAYYPAPAGILAQLLLPLAKPTDYLERPRHRAKLENLPAHVRRDEQTSRKRPPLTSDQATALKAIQTSPSNTAILHGDTGTGKTRVYIELAEASLKAGKSVIVLVPEIALSPQMIKSFSQHIEAPIHITHSGLTPAQRRVVWHAIASQAQPQVVIGPRSALFSPVENVGLIVIDEFHEPAYKQDQAPYYQTTRVASALANLHKARLVMGSATPPVSEYYVAEQKQLPIIRMKQKASSQATAETKTSLVSLKDSAEKTRYPLVSQTLLDAIKATLGRQEQVLLFLNKRGSARLLLCQNCGWHALCDRCDLPYTYHGDTHQLICHTCGNQQPAPSVCPECTSHDMIFKSPGTKAIVEAITHAFPEARIARFDRDNKKLERLETRHDEITSGEIDILIGTQLLAKGHDLPRLALVGILLAENELQFPDYTSSERSYQLMHQLIGRVGRGHRAGTVIVQTYDPDNLAVQAAVGNYAWPDFYAAQIQERSAFGFPPFYYVMKIEISRARLTTVQNTCNQIIKQLADSGERVAITGPSPSFVEKRNNTWNWQIIVKAKQRASLTRLAGQLPANVTINLDPHNLL